MAITDCPLPPGARVVAYLRDSGGPAQDRSVHQQQVAAELFACEHNLALVRVFSDEARPGSSVVGREAFEEMIHWLRRLRPEKGQPDPAAPEGVIYWDIKRFSRSQDDGAYFRADLRRRGYVLVSLSDTIPAGDLAPVFEALFSWKAEQDLRDLAKDVKRGLSDLVRTRGPDGRYLGLHPGTPPTGFKIEPYTLGITRSGRPRVVSRWVPDPETWERVRLAWEMRAQGAPVRAIHEATHLFDKGASYSMFFTRRIYTGDLVTATGEIIEDWLPACISRDLYEAVIARRKPSGRHGARTGTSDYMLSGWLRCGLCGGNMRGTRHQIRHKDQIYVYRRYFCSRRSIQRFGSVEPCRMQSMNADKLEERVLAELAAAFLTPASLSRLVAEADPDREEVAVLEREAAGLQAEKAEVEQAIERLIAAVEAGGGIPELVERLVDRRAERARLDTKLLDVEDRIRTLTRAPMPPEMLADFCENAQLVLAVRNIEDVRSLISVLVEHIVVAADRSYQIEYKRWR